MSAGQKKKQIKKCEKMNGSKWTDETQEELHWAYTVGKRTEGEKSWGQNGWEKTMLRIGMLNV